MRIYINLKYRCHKELEDFFEGLNLPQISIDETHQLDSPITLKELLEALEDMKPGKSPG